MTPTSPTPRTQVRRGANRSAPDRLYEILDAGLVCHLGVVIDGSPRVIPTGYGRLDDTLYLHGSSGAASLRHGPSGDICVTVTHLDGIVVARSLFNHSLNYRSAIVYGTPTVLTGDEKVTGLRVITERLAPGQWDTARPPTRKELAATTVLALPLTEASVKIRQGPPGDDPEDYALDTWAGVLPLQQSFLAPVPDPALRPGIEVPPHITSRTS